MLNAVVALLVDWLVGCRGGGLETTAGNYRFCDCQRCIRVLIRHCSLPDCLVGGLAGWLMSLLLLLFAELEKLIAYTPEDAALFDFDMEERADKAAVRDKRTKLEAE